MPIPSRRLLNRLKDAAEWVEENDGEPRVRGRRGSSTEPYTARVTSGTADGNGNYPAVITDWDGSAWVDYGVVAVKAGNGETLTSGTRYAVRPVGTPSGSAPVYVTVMGAGGSMASLEVRENDGSPSVTSCVLIRTNQSHGLRTVLVAAGDARIDLDSASASVSGKVDTSAQTFAGLKSFSNGAIVYTTTTVNSDYPAVIAFNVLGATGLEQSLWLAAFGTTLPNIYWYEKGVGYQGQITAGTNEIVVRALTTAGASNGEVLVSKVGGNERCTLVGGAGAQFAVNRSGTISAGTDGTFLSQDGFTVTVVGGLVKSIV